MVVMKKSTFFLVLMVAFSPLIVNAQQQNIEFGLQVGTGFFIGSSTPVNGFVRTHEFAWMRDSKEMPAFETYGGMMRYRIDERWAVQVQALRQRTRFKEERLNVGPNEKNMPMYFYNSMWHLDAMAEFNILKYGFIENRNAKIYTVTPYVAVGIGTTMYNKAATYRWGWNDGTRNTMYPAVKVNDKVQNEKMVAALYIPFAAGLKVRMHTNWQLKVACQYNLYVLNGNLDGYTTGVWKNRNDLEEGLVYPDGGGIAFKEGSYKAASTHNVSVTVGVIYNLPAKGQGGAIISY